VQFLESFGLCFTKHIQNFTTVIKVWVNKSVIYRNEYIFVNKSFDTTETPAVIFCQRCQKDGLVVLIMKWNGRQNIQFVVSSPRLSTWLSARRMIVTCWLVVTGSQLVTRRVVTLRFPMWSIFERGFPHLSLNWSTVRVTMHIFSY
jgi:hypothetical protein